MFHLYYIKSTTNKHTNINKTVHPTVVTVWLTENLVRTYQIFIGSVQSFLPLQRTALIFINQTVKIFMPNKQKQMNSFQSEE